MPPEAASSVKGAVKDAVSSAQDALPDGGGQAPAAAADAAKSSPFGALFSGARGGCSCLRSPPRHTAQHAWTQDTTMSTSRWQGCGVRRQGGCERGHPGA